MIVSTKMKKQKKCLDCGKNIHYESTRCRSCATKTPEYRKKLSEQKKGKLNPNYGKRNEQMGRWKGGRIIRRGYIFIKKDEHPNANYAGYVQEHRLIMEKEIGRYLTKKELVHHINGLKDDNRIENLKIVSISEHMSGHMMGNTHCKGKKLPEEVKRKISLTMKRKFKNRKRGLSGKFLK